MKSPWSYFLLKVSKLSVYTSVLESTELFVIYSNIRVTQNHNQSLQILKNYPILSDPFESEQPLVPVAQRIRTLMEKCLEYQFL